VRRQWEISDEGSPRLERGVAEEGLGVRFDGAVKAMLLIVREKAFGNAWVAEPLLVREVQRLGVNCAFV